MKDILSFLNFDPKTQSGITNITVWLAMLVYFLFINFFIVPVAVPNQPENYTFYLFVLFVPAATKLIFFSGDSISFRKNREAEFFQQQFPDKYIAQKYEIALPQAQHLWFKCLDKRAEDGEIKRTFQYGYTCRLVYYTRRLTFVFFCLSLVLLIGNAALNYFRVYGQWMGWHAVWQSILSIANLKGKLFYLLHIGGISLYLRLANSTASKKPSGVWARWKHINDRNKAWIDRFATLKALSDYVYPGVVPDKNSEVTPSN